jgi:pimeloyl-ACP methyl ester carboxylesterase
MPAVAGRTQSMTGLTGTAAPTGAIPIVFQAGGGPCFGWFHAAGTPARGVGVVMCRPLGYEGLCAYQTYTQLAETLAAAGFDVVRFDYHGTGDSAGSDSDPARVRAWGDSVRAAIGEVRRYGGVSRVALFGLRLGATLAAHAASEIGGVESLVMWAPFTTGHSLVRELRAANANRPSTLHDDIAPEDVEALGFLFTQETVRDLETLDCRSLSPAPAQRVLIIGRDDMPIEGPLPEKYRAAGMDTTYTVLPGYASMMVEPHEVVLEQSTLEFIRDWLAAAPEPQRATPAPTKVEPVYPAGYELEGVRETPITFGTTHALFGILSEPAQLPDGDRHCDTAILMLNVGGNYRIGPNRIHVKIARSMAAAGYRAFRLDLTGIGDSHAGAAFCMNNLYAKDSSADVRAAIDCLAAKGCKNFYLMGICSGSYVAFQTALVEPRVAGQILMNSRLLEWRDDRAGESWQASMQIGYKSTDFYLRALLRPEVYRRLLFGEINVGGIARRFKTIIEARLGRAMNRLVRGSTPEEEEGVFGKMKKLSERGTDTLVISAAEDDGRDYLEFHLGRRGKRMKGSPNFRMILVDDCDHTFSSEQSQQFVINTMQEHLRKRAAAQPSPPEPASPAFA